MVLHPHKRDSGKKRARHREDSQEEASTAVYAEYAKKVGKETIGVVGVFRGSSCASFLPTIVA